MKKPTKNSERNKADKLCTPVALKVNPFCLFGPEKAEVAHHFFHRSKSTALRYEPSNLISLCHHHHIALHHNESEYTARILKIKGMEWFEKLEKIKNQTTVKADLSFYQSKREFLEGLLK